MPGKETLIHEQALVHPGAQLDEGVEVGPFSVIGPMVRIGAGTVVSSHAVIEGRTTIGRDNRIFQFASVGTIPQDLKYDGEDSELVIGDRNRIRECSTFHLGTEDGGMLTRIGDDNLFMAYCHVAHDCIVGNGVIMANAATLGGHVVVDDQAIIGGLTGVHQFCRIGSMTMIAASSLVAQDIPPYTTAQGDRAALVGLNVEGLKRKGFSKETISSLKAAYRTLFRSGMTMADAVAALKTQDMTSPEVSNLLAFVENSERGVARDRSSR
jgi:UDP-N-acetylglucosamine acyltransferase